ncbi:MAG: protein adenylyltransferase SelO family protein [Synechococcus sp.]
MPAPTPFTAFANHADYSLLEALTRDPDASSDGNDHQAREVRSGHYVPVTPTPLPEPQYVAHSQSLFAELGLSDALAHDGDFQRWFSGDSSVATGAMPPYGWATGYALSIYGTEYNRQCPFGTGNGYGDGRALSVFEGVFEGQRWEMQLKGGGPTPYCRGGDGRAVLRSSMREFLAQELMHALGVPTSRSLTLYRSTSERVLRPWYAEQSQSLDPDVMVDNAAAITTRVAPSFLRVGQLELFARRARSEAHPQALQELAQITTHLIGRNYRDAIDPALPFAEQVVELARQFRTRLTQLVAGWMRVGYCQGNFNSDNCAAGGYTLDYGPFGFCEIFDPRFQPWTGGGDHFCFFNQPAAAEANFEMFWRAMVPLLQGEPAALEQLQQIRDGFAGVMEEALDGMWANKLGLGQPNPPLVRELLALMAQSRADYTLLFRALSAIPTSVEPLQQSFYGPSSDALTQRWEAWLGRWRHQLGPSNGHGAIAAAMERVNPAITWREWLIAPAYQQAEQGDTQLIQELQQVFSNPYATPSQAVQDKYCQRRPQALLNTGGIAHYSCSS